MTISMYDASAPVFSQMLNNLAHVIGKAEANATERKIDPSIFVNARLAPDMLPLKRQIMIATDHAKGAMSRLAGVEIPSFPDTEETFGELAARIAKARAYVATFKPDQLNGSATREIVWKAGQLDMKMPGQQYLLHYAMPNFYFHVTMAYAILRENGVGLGKGDFFGRG